LFSCNRWLDSSEDDGQTARELSIDGPDGKPTLAWVHYRVQVMFSTNCNNYFINNALSTRYLLVIVVVPVLQPMFLFNCMVTMEILEQE